MSNVTHLPQAKQKSLTASEVLELIPGLTYKRLEWWTGTGRIKAIPSRHIGSGHHREYALDQVAVISRIFRLVQLGFNLNAAHQMATDRATAEKVLMGVSNIVIEHINEEEEAT